MVAGVHYNLRDHVQGKHHFGIECVTKSRLIGADRGDSLKSYNLDIYIVFLFLICSIYDRMKCIIYYAVRSV